MFRKVIFWLHLVAGLAGGVAIAIMCFTGTALAFEKQLVAWSERDYRSVTALPGQTRLTLDELSQRVREAQPNSRPSAIIVAANSHEAVTYSLGRDSTVFVNPYSGAVIAPSATWMRGFMQTMTEWHRFLAMSGDRRATGKLVNGTCNLTFFVLAVTGLYLWIPRRWSWRGVRSVAFFSRGLSGKGRDFNWHNVIGLWTAPILIVLTLTAIPISFRWGSALVFRIVGEEPPTQQGPAANSLAPIAVNPPLEGAKPLSRQAQFTAVQTAYPAWEQITLRLATPARSGAPAEERNRSRPTATETPAHSAPADEAPPGKRHQNVEPATASTTPATTFIVKTPGVWPRTATTTLVLNPFSGEILRRDDFADQTAGRRLRTWTRFLHTGEALGWWGQALAGLASLGGCFLVYTGISLAWRRFFGRRVRESTP